MPPATIITISEVESIAFRVFKNNFVELAGEAATIADGRARAFTHNLLSRLAREKPASLDKANDPAFLQSIYRAQAQVALTGDEQLQDVLIQLLISLAESKIRSLREISLSEAIERSGKITPGQLSILSLLFVSTLVRWEVRYRTKDFSNFVSDVIEPFCCDEAADARNYSHLASLGCIEVGAHASEFEVFLMTHFRTLFSNGIPREALIHGIDEGEKYLPLFESFDGDPSKLRFRFQTNESIQEAAIRLGVPASWRSTFQIDARYLMTSPEKLAYAASLNPAIESLRSIWTLPNALLPRSSLTTTGIALAHSALAAMGKAPAPLSKWL